MRRETQIGFKIARIRLNSGDKVLKYGAELRKAAEKIVNQRIAQTPTLTLVRRTTWFEATKSTVTN